MIAAEDCVGALQDRGFRLGTGVPCSHFAGPTAELTRRGKYIPAPNEGAALALAAGASATGKPAVVFTQNSGFGNLLNPLTSLVIPYRIPVLVFMSLRGWPDPGDDEPQHRVMGSTTHRLLDTLQVSHHTIAASTTDAAEAINPALSSLEEGRPHFILVQKGAIGPPGSNPSIPTTPDEGGLLDQTDAIRAVVSRLPDALIVSTTGYISRRLFSLADSGRIFYMQGSMGHASAFGLGTALSVSQRTVVVLDGDGAALMHLGTMSTIGASGAENLVHVIIDNGTYESTGGQATCANTTAFDRVARAIGYRTATVCRCTAAAEEALDRTRGAPGPHLVVLKTGLRAGAPPARATSAMSAPEISTRFAAAAESREAGQ